MANKQLFVNNFLVALASDVSTTIQTLFTLTDVTGLSVLSGGDYYLLVLKTATKTEIVKVTAVNIGLKQITVVRAHESVGPFTFVTGTQVAGKITAEPLNAFVDAIETADAALPKDGSEDMTGELTINSAGTCATYNRTGSDGAIQSFKKGGTEVGKIMTRSSLVSTFVLDPRGNGVALTATSGALLPADEDGALNPDALDIGTAANRFKNGRFSDGLYVGTENASSNLQADSTTKGFLMPRMTNTQMNAIGTPAEGLQVYNTTFKRTFTYDGSIWNIASTRDAKVAMSGTVVDAVDGGYFSKSISSNEAFTITNPLQGQTLMLDITGSSGAVLTLPASVKALNGGSWTVDARNIIMITMNDAGTEQVASFSTI